MDAFVTQPAFFNLKKTIFLLVVGTISLTFSFETARHYYQYKQSLSDTGKKVKTHVSAVSEHTSRIIEGVDLALKHVTYAYQHHWLPENRSDIDIHHLLLGIKLQLPQLRDIIIINREGTVIHDSGIYPTRKLDLADRAYFEFHRDSPGDQLYIGEPLKGRNSGKWFLAISRSIGSSKEDFIGVVGAIVDPNYFWKFYDMLSQANGIQTIFYHQNGVVISSSTGLTSGESLIGQSISDRPIFLQDTAVISGENKTYLAAGKLIEKGNEYWGTFDHLSGTTNTVKLKIAALISKKEALTHFRQSLLNTFAFSLMIIILTSGLMVVSFRQINARRKTNDDLLKAVARTKKAEKHVAKINKEFRRLMIYSNSELKNGHRNLRLH